MNYPLFITVLFFSFLSINCQAGLFRAESETLNSIRVNDKNKTEAPTYEFVSASFVNEKRDFEINSDFSMFADPTGNASNKAYLYIMDARYSVVPDFMTIRCGRSFDVVNTVGPSSVDILSAEFYLMNKQVRLGAFVGIERKLESFDSDLHSNIAGVRADYHSDDRQPLYLSTKFEQRVNVSNNNSMEDLLQFSGKKPLPGAWNPEFIIDSVSDVYNSNLNRLEFGFDVYPSIVTFSKIRFMTYDVLPQTGIEQPIFSLFSTGPLYEGRYQFEKKLSPKFTGSFSVFYDDYLLVGTQRTSGLGGEIEGKFLHDSGTKFNNVVYYFESYGGTAIGDRIGAQTETSKKNEFYGLLDMTYYEKITSSRRGAFTGEAGWTRYLGQKFKLTLSAQASSNNVLKEDFRSVARLTYLLWDEI